MPDYQALVKRLRANLDKYPGFVNLNAEAATAIETLLARQKVLVAEVEASRNLVNDEGYTYNRNQVRQVSVPIAQRALKEARAATDAAFPGGLPK